MTPYKDFPGKVRNFSLSISCAKVSSFLFFIVCITISISCNEAKNKGSVPAINDTTTGAVKIAAATIAGNFSGQSLLKLDSNTVGPFLLQYPDLSSFKNEINRFYTNRDFTFAWYNVNGQIEQAGNLYNRLKNLHEEGVMGNVPYLGSLDSLMDSPDAKDERVRTTTELMLTAFYFYFAEKVWGGLDEKKTRQIDWFLPRKKIDYDLWLDTLLQVPGGFSKTPEPVYRQYHLLKSYLQQYSELSKDKWQPLKTDKKSYRLGDSAELILEIKKRLSALGDLPTFTENRLFDVTLEDGIKSFQKRFGRKEDGVIGQQLVSELNEPIEKRIQQISVNMERSRWLPDEMKGEYLAVNIPEFKLHAYNSDSLLWSMNVVVGQAINKTVIFSGDLKYVVFSPYWNVPSSILKKEILPGIRKNKNYLQSHHMEWNGSNVRQTPGPWNSLGQVKFLFPNSFSIYLHDTPSKSLFEDDKRDFSHGCIRVAEPKKLASFLLKNDSSWNETKITTAMNSGKEQYVTLKKTVPVFIAYFTVWVDRQGKLNFRDDIYDRDKALADIVVTK